MAWSNIIIICFWSITLVFYSVEYLKNEEKPKPPFSIFILAIITILITQLQMMLGGE